MAIDAFAMTTNLSIILDQKPKKLILVNEKNYQKALNFYEKTILIGESNQLSTATFAVSNAPSDIVKINFKGKSVIYMTINGTRVFEKFAGHGQVLGCAFNNLKAVANYLKGFQKITIALAGDYPNTLLEDKLCAQILGWEIEGKKYDWEDFKKKMRKFIRNYYNWPPDKEIASLRIVFDKSKYAIIPAGFINKEGFVEVKCLE